MTRYLFLALLLCPLPAHAGTLDCSPMASSCYISDHAYLSEADKSDRYRGGLDDEWLADEAQIRARGQRIEIGGECYSNCANMADRLRPQVCLYPTAKLFFHKSRSQDMNRIYSERIPPGLHSDILALIEKHGGWKSANVHGGDYIEIDYQEARAYWPACK